MARKIMIVVTAGLITMSAAACNTVRGVAADLDSAADGVDEAT
ncbi:hypothetical protein [Aurantiacibacter gangjinensis]|nr:hypothetical protein [Aurantiacibacter gangjinensis]APE29154.1 hypothetical protein BMF35_a2325 [Aurantiacibacter gangjinensis]